ncbi:MAG: type II secretion system F family protein [Phycisphaeraceae bacterium]|nr:type II secretion system F family protein [Phycisphaeraceae bacterium]
MDIDLLKTFVEVVRTRHFGKAAENLYITQSAVSFRIRQLEQGLGVSDAIAMSVPEIPLRQAKLLQASDRIGRLPQAVGRLLDEYVLHEARQTTHVVPNMRYLLTVFLLMSLVLSAMLVFIIPKFNKIFEDFDMVLPDATLNLIGFTCWLGGSLPGQTMPGLAWFLLVLISVVIFHFTRNRDGWFGWLYQQTVWRLPVIKMVHRPTYWAMACHQVADGLDAGLPLEASLQLTSQSLDHCVVAHQFKRWKAGLLQGQDLGDAVKHTGLPKMFGALLSNQAQQQNLPDVMRYLAHYYCNLTQQRQVWLQAVYAPSVVLLLALPTAWICIGMFMPLVVLIQKMAQQTGMY